MNTQKPLKASHREDGRLSVFSVFPTIQGEGPHAGRPAIFIRLAGCNLQCIGCDTSYTSEKEPITPAALALAVNNKLSDIAKSQVLRWLVVITGGEPFRQNIAPLCSALLRSEFDIQIETNGTLYNSELPAGVEIVCSPKTGSLHKGLVERGIDALKYVVEADYIDNDGLPTRVLGSPSKIAKPPPYYDRRKIYIQPMDSYDPSQNKRNLSAAIESCLLFGYNLCLQTHKIVGLE
jgi:organic radical activating enzyme